MFDFESDMIANIDEKDSVLFEIERVLFTRRYKLSKKHFEIFSVQSIAMVYSIWEGFVQQSFRLYVEELNSLQIPFTSYSDSIRIYHIETVFKQLNDYPQKERKKIEFYEALNIFHQNEYHSLTTLINTQSNVSFEVLNNILKTFSLTPFDEHWKSYKHPNPNLKDMLKSFLKYRNSISHGGDISSEEKVTQDVYVKYKRLVIDLMYGVYDKMLLGLKDKSYLKN